MTALQAELQKMGLPADTVEMALQTMRELERGFAIVAPPVVEDVTGSEGYRAFLAKRTRNVRNRIERLNPTLKAYERPRGWHPTRSFKSIRFELDMVSRRDYEKRWGTGTFEHIRPDLVRRDGKRKCATRHAMDEGPYGWHEKVER